MGEVAAVGKVQGEAADSRSPPRPAGVFVMQALLFERPAYLIPAVVSAELILLLIWRRWQTPPARQAVRLGLILFPMMIVVQSLVTTDRERIVLVCRQLATSKSP